MSSILRARAEQVPEVTAKCPYGTTSTPRSEKSCWNGGRFKPQGRPGTRRGSPGSGRYSNFMSPVSRYVVPKEFSRLPLLCPTNRRRRPRQQSAKPELGYLASPKSPDLLRPHWKFRNAARSATNMKRAETTGLSASNTTGTLGRSNAQRPKNKVNAVSAPSRRFPAKPVARRVQKSTGGTTIKPQPSGGPKSSQSKTTSAARRQP